MARPRTDLQLILEGAPGVTAAYFQAPLNTKLHAPYIVYETDDEWVSWADNIVYQYMERYNVTVVDRDPDSLVRGFIRDLPHARFNRKFVTNGLHHFVYTLHF